LSKDEELLKSNDWIFNDKLKYFLDGQPFDNRLVFASSPRTGNSFLRKYLENTLGVYTGADMPLYMV
jgi:hypothetical protein